MCSLIDHFNARYEIVRATSEELLRESQRLRYKVFCSEKPLFDRDNFSEGLERDEFDSRSVHSFIRNRTKGLAVASVRLVLSDPENDDAPFPLEKHCGGPMGRDVNGGATYKRGNLGEISRFAVSREEFQLFDRGEILIDRRGCSEIPSSRGDRRAGERRKSKADRRGVKSNSEEIIENAHVSSGSLERRGNIRRVWSGRRLFNYLTVGLARAVMEIAVDKKVTHLYACMEPALCRLLTKYSIFFDHVGPVVNYFGKRQPCFAAIDKLLEKVFNERYDIWEFITDGGRLCSPSSTCNSSGGSY